MKKRYLEKVEDVLALKDSDTKIYSEIDKLCELKFIDGILCKIDKKTHCVDFNIDIYIDPDNDVFYILEEEPMQEATEEDIGTLCRFWGRDYKDAELGILKEVSYDGDEVRYLSKEDYWYYHCHKLTSSEIAELTGYKVEEK